MLYILVMVCAGNLSAHECNERTARAYQAHVEAGLMCGLPSQLTIAQSPIAPTADSGEYVKVKCKYQPN